MTNVRRLFYNTHGRYCIKKRYRYKKAYYPDTCFDASKLPEDLDFSEISIRLGTNVHSEKFPIFGFAVKFKKENNSNYYFDIANIENAPVSILSKFIEAVKRHEKIYYRALKELGDSGNLLKDLGL